MTTLDDIVKYSKSDWGGRPAARAIPNVQHTHLEVHHGASSNRLAVEDPWRAIRGYQNFHLDTKKWSDIFYNTLLTPSNRLAIGRGIGKRSEGTALTCCLVGNHELVDVRPEQLGTLKLLAESTPAGVKGIDWHARRAAGTRFASACPGKFAIDRIRQLIQGGASLPVPNPTKPGENIMPFAEAFAVVRQTYIDAWGRPGDPAGTKFWVETLMKTGFVGWVRLMDGLHKIGQDAKK